MSKPWLLLNRWRKSPGYRIYTIILTYISQHQRILIYKIGMCAWTIYHYTKWCCSSGVIYVIRKLLITNFVEKQSNGAGSFILENLKICKTITIGKWYNQLFQKLFRGVSMQKGLLNFLCGGWFSCIPLGCKERKGISCAYMRQWVSSLQGNETYFLQHMRARMLWSDMAPQCMHTCWW